MFIYSNIYLFESLINIIIFLICIYKYQSNNKIAIFYWQCNILYSLFLCFLHKRIRYLFVFLKWFYLFIYFTSLFLTLFHAHKHAFTLTLNFRDFSYYALFHFLQRCKQEVKCNSIGCFIGRMFMRRVRIRLSDWMPFRAYDSEPATADNINIRNTATLQCKV